MDSTKNITLRGVRVHNLKNVNVDIPLGKLTIVTGVSGAGKRSLVFDTLYAEAQRRYLQSFSAYTRQFLERFEKPEAEEIGPIPPAIAIRPSSARKSPRTTVASLTEIGDLVRLLFANIGKQVCPTCGQAVLAHRTPDVIAAVRAMPVGTKAVIAFPGKVPEGADLPAWLASLLEEGYVRIRIADKTYRLDESPPPMLPSSPIWILLDRIEIGKTSIERLTESIDAAFRRGNGRIGVLTDTNDCLYDQHAVCLRCQRAFPTLEPRLLDANDPLGACRECDGRGAIGKGETPCSICKGTRWSEDATAVRIGACSIADWFALPLNELMRLLSDLPTSAVLDQVRSRIDTLVSLDLGYLTLGQPASTVSDGAERRIALATALSSQLVHVLYLVDEPTVDMHPRDTEKLVGLLLKLRDQGNTVIVIDHEEALIAAADHRIELGPGAGEEGGRVTYHGVPHGMTVEDEPTEQAAQRRRKPAGWLKLSGANVNNLQDVTVEVPLGVLCAVTGVSGAGKRSLIERTLYPALCAAKKQKCAASLTDAKLSGAQSITEVVLLDQQPLARSARSNPATFLKIFDGIRELFAETVDAKIRNFGPGHFSFNQPGGRCETCEGQGALTIDMQFLADVTSTCPECLGQRYRKEVLDIKVRSLNVAQVLDLTIREAFRFFRAQPAIEKKLKTLLDVGLEYLRLGQATDTLSASEGQRLKLASFAASSRKTGCMFLIIEPMAGLHPEDVANLADCFDRLVAAGHSVIVIEHHLDLIRRADWLIDLGPEGGKHGGRIMAQGTPEMVAKVTESWTGIALKRAFAE